MLTLTPRMVVLPTWMWHSITFPKSLNLSSKTVSSSAGWFRSKFKGPLDGEAEKVKHTLALHGIPLSGIPALVKKGELRAAIHFSNVYPSISRSRHVDWDLEYEKPSAKAEIFKSLLSVMKLCSRDHEQEMAVNLKELLSLSNLDICPIFPKNPNLSPVISLDSCFSTLLLEMDLICLNNKTLVDKRSAVYLVNPDGTRSDVPCAFLLPKVEMMNFSSDNKEKNLF
jgi:hypothetical protein